MNERTAPIAAESLKRHLSAFSSIPPIGASGQAAVATELSHVMRGAAGEISLYWRFMMKMNASSDFPWKRAALIGVLGIVVIGCVGTLLWKNAFIRFAAVDTTLRAIGAGIPHDAFGQINILLLGTGDDNHDGADLTDTMIIASIDPTKTGSVVLVSLPRDLYLDANKTLVSGRINALYANEKYRLMRGGQTESGASFRALSAVNEEMSIKTGMELHGAVKVNFTALVTLIDSVGGIDIDVPEAIMDYTYPVSEGRTGTFSIEAGVQHLDGETALKYARSRHSTNDFDRSARQQLILRALAEKVRSLPLTEQLFFAHGLKEELGKNIETTFSLPEIVGIAQVASSLSLEKIISHQINFYTGGSGVRAEAGGFVTVAPPELFEGASILLPNALPGEKQDWRQIRTFIAFLTRLRSAYLEQAPIVLHKSGQESAKLGNELRRYGFMVEEISFDEDSWDNAVLQYERSAKHTASFIGTLLGVKQSVQDIVEGSGALLLLFDETYTYQPFQVLSGAVLNE